MGNKLLKIVLTVFLLIGAGIFLYPRFSGYIEHIRQARVIENYQNSSDAITEQMYEAMRAQAEEYNKKLAEQPDFDHAVALARGQYSKEYRALLDIDGNGVMGSISIPKIGVELPLYHGTQERDLVRGVGHYEGTSLPVGGESTHTVLSGHRGLPSADLFTRLDEVEKGDLFVINTLGKELTYRVDQIRTVLPDETDDLAIVPGKDYATLVTCTPYGINSHRLLIRGERTKTITKEERKKLEETKKEEDRTLERLLESGALVMAILLATALIIWRVRRRSAE